MVRKRSVLLIALHVAGLWTIAIVQPLLDVLGRAPEFFAAHRAGPMDILLLLATLAFAAPLALAALVALADAVGGRTRALVTGTIVAVLVSVLAVQVLKQAGVTTWAIAVGPAALSGVGTAI